MGCNVIGETIKEKCEKAGVNYNNVVYYKSKHPELTYEQVINYYESKIYDKTLIQKCKEVGLKHKVCAIRSYKSNHPELTLEQIIERFLGDCKRQRDKKSIKFKCEQLGISYAAVSTHKRDNPELSYDTVIELYKNKEDKGYRENKKTLKQRCEEYGFNYTAVKTHKSKYDLTDDEVINYFIDKHLNKTDTFRKKCKEAGVKNLDGAYMYRKRHAKISDDKLIEEYKLVEEKRELDINSKKIYNEAGIDYRNTYYYRNKYPELSDEQIIEIIKGNKDIESFAQKCYKYDINLDKAYKYKLAHKELTVTQVILHYRPDLYVNILGELIE